MPESGIIWCWAPRSWRSPGAERLLGAIRGLTGGEEYRIVAVPITDLGNYALVLGRPLQPTNDILSSLWLVLIIFGGGGVIIAAVVGATSPAPACDRYANCPQLSNMSASPRS